MFNVPASFVEAAAVEEPITGEDAVVAAAVRRDLLNRNSTDPSLIVRTYRLPSIDNATRTPAFSETVANILAAAGSLNGDGDGNNEN